MRALGLPVFLPKWLGGFEVPHFENKPASSTRSLDRRMVSIVLRDDQSLAGARQNMKLGGLWSVHNASPLGEKISEEAESHYSMWSGSEWSLNKVAVALGVIPPGATAPYGDLWFIDCLEKRALDELGLMTYQKYNGLLEGILYSNYVFDLDGPKTEKPPSLRKIAKAYIRTRDEILKSDQHKYRPLAGTPEDWLKLRRWKLRSVFLPFVSLPTELYPPLPFSRVEKDYSPSWC